MAAMLLAMSRITGARGSHAWAMALTPMMTVPTVKLTGTLDSVPKLYQTRDLTAAARQSAGRYGAALQNIL